MAIIKWDPFAELNLYDQVNSLFNDNLGASRSVATAPTTDIFGDEKHLTIETHLPNFKEEEITVNHHEGAVEIKAEHSEKEKERNYL